MTAELWLHKLCPHGNLVCWVSEPLNDNIDPPTTRCLGGSQMRLDPEQVVFPPIDFVSGKGVVPAITVADIIDALEKEE